MNDNSDGGEQYDWLKNRICPNCGDLLFSDWYWADAPPFNSELERWQEYATWYLVCEECQENFADVDGVLQVIQ